MKERLHEWIGKLRSGHVPDFLFDGGDGYTMFQGQKVLVAREAGPTLATALEQYIAQQREVAPEVDGRIMMAK